MAKNTLIQIIKADASRFVGGKNVNLFTITRLYFRFPTLAIIILLRIIQHVHNRAMSFPFKYLYFRKRMKTGIQIPLSVKIGKGCLFCHFSCIVFAEGVKVGDFCSIHQGVTIGRSFSGGKKGVPTIGNHVILFPGSKVIGNVHIGNNVIVGTNAVVLDDVPDNSVVAGIPAHIVSNDSNRALSEEWVSFFAWNRES